MKYTTEEARARFEAWLIREHEYAPEDLIWQEKRNCYADYATHLAWNAYRDAYADLLERIEADEGAVPTFSRSDVSKWRGDAFENAAQIVDRYAEHFPEVTGAADDIRALIAHPPAQAAQVGPAAKPRTLSDFVHASDAERAQIGQQVAARVDEMMAEPVTQDEVDWIAALRKELLHSKMTHNFTFTRDEVMQLIGDPFPQPAQSVDVKKVRRVAADIRHWNEAICHPALNVFADKLEAALQEKGNG